MTRKVTFIVAALFVSGLTADTRADFLIYKLDDELRVILHGEVTVNPGGTVSFRHPTISEALHFSSDQYKKGEIEIKRAPTIQQEYAKLRGQAGKDPEAVLKAAVWALKKGRLTDFYAGVDAVLKLEPTHEAALRIKELKKQMDKPLPENSSTEKRLRSIVNRPKMRIEKSNHFILLHDTDAKPEPGHRKTRAKERLDLLEKVYESFLLLFHAQDVQLDIPTERMMVVLFKEEPDFRDYAVGLHPSMASAAGFWEQIRNVSYFYDHGTTKTFKALQKAQAEMHKIAKDARKMKGGGDLIRLVKTLDLLIEEEKENSDVTVVSHEATHQMAGNTGLLPRHVEIPSWVHEGLATYFEAPGDATWAGIGAVNEERLAFYRVLEPDRVHSNIDFIVGDQIFDYAANIYGILHGYAQAWALTHFMLENHTKEFVSFYRMLGEMPPDVPMSPELLTQLFSRVFGSDHKSLDQEWRSYMRTLKTDYERMEEESDKKGFAPPGSGKKKSGY
ncbi:MAG TPA: DUF1570 domain-containing protein [Planctomycetaceae bacterium]|nr:DUF1570 domain-containing protein [Planctomycetaceae bacterium]